MLRRQNSQKAGALFAERVEARGERKLYKPNCAALHKYKIFRSEHWNGTLEGNSCSRLIDNIEFIPFT